MCVRHGSNSSSTFLGTEGETLMHNDADGGCFFFLLLWLQLLSGVNTFSSLLACIISTSYFRSSYFCQHGFRGFIIDWRYFLVSSFVRYLMWLEIPYW